MLKKIMIPVILVTAIILASCSNMNEPSKTAQSYKDGKGSETIITNSDIFTFNPNCQPVSFDLVIDDDVNDIWIKNAVKVGTVTYSNDNDNLQITFQLDPASIALGYKLSVVAGMGFIWDGVNPNRHDYYSRHYKREDISAQNLTTYTMYIPRVAFDPEHPWRDLSWNCGDVLAVWAYAQICKPGQVYGNGINYSLTGNGLQNGKIIHPIIAGQNINAGNIILEIDGGDLVLTYQLNNDWALKQTHFDFEDNCSDIPKTQNNGNFIPGQFTYSNSFTSPYIQHTYSFRIPITEDLCGKDFCAAAHATVVGVGTSNSGQEQTGWGGDIKDPNSSKWQYYFQFGLTCEPGFGQNPECVDTWVPGNGRICVWKFEDVDRYWYWVNIGYQFCCK